jgi:hypothetical protein
MSTKKKPVKKIMRYGEVDIPYLPEGIPKQLQDELAAEAVQRRAEQEAKKPAAKAKKPAAKKPGK